MRWRNSFFYFFLFCGLASEKEKEQEKKGGERERKVLIFDLFPFFDSSSKVCSTPQLRDGYKASA